MSLLVGGVFSQTAINKTEIPQDELDIVNKSRSNPLQWNGQFSPQLIQALLHKYSKPNFTVFDPFLGSGTVLLEAGLLGLSASGTEINPAAVTLAQTYQFINIDPEKRKHYFSQVKKILLSKVLKNAGYLSAQDNIEKLKSILLGLAKNVDDEYQRQIIDTIIVLLDFYKADFSTEKVLKIFSKLEKHIVELPFSASKISIHHADARQVPVSDSIFDLVVTSPPYINVFNYHQQYRASMEALNWDLLKVAQSEFGANRKHRSNRFFTVIQFCLDMAQTLKELERVCKPASKIIFVVGRKSMVRGTSFYNGEIVAEIAHKALGYELAMRQERVFTNRFGEKIFEDILHLSHPQGNSPVTFLEKAQSTARQVLEASYSVSSKTAQADILMAIENIEKIKPSPLFNLSSSLKFKEVHNAPIAYPAQREIALVG